MVAQANNRKIYGATLSYEDEHQKVSITRGDADMSTGDFRDLCMDIAAGIGYCDANIQEYFNEGEEYMLIVEKLQAEIASLKEQLDDG